MSVRSFMTVRAATRTLTAPRMAFSTSSRFNLKESSSQTGADYEKHKTDSLEKQKSGAGHWKPELSSDSEEAIQADKNSEDPATLAEKTKHVAEETAKKGTSQS